MNGGAVAATLRPRAPLAAESGILGIRPKHIEWEPLKGAAEESWLPAIVAEIDDTGDDALIFADVGGEQIRVLETRGRSVAVGDAIAIRLPDQAVHLFVDDIRVEAEEAALPASVG
jgi:ABC-type sugar transport system ATPase subunit